MTAWNADATRMPCRTHSEYLRRLYLNNDLAEGRFEVEGKPVTLRDIHVPLFAVSQRNSEPQHLTKSKRSSRPESKGQALIISP
jgi:poly(3-hydroxyalkanoate) synthetase